MHWFVPLVFLGFAVYFVFISLVTRRLPKVQRFLFSLLNIALIACLGYVFSEFVVNKGPDDVGSLWHAGYPLKEKYGSAHRTSYRIESFDKDPDSSGSGTYHIHFVYDTHWGTVLCHYDKAAHRFDHDEVVGNN